MKLKVANKTNINDNPNVVKITSRPLSNSSPFMRRPDAWLLRFVGLHSINLVNSPDVTDRTARREMLIPAIPLDALSKVPASVVTDMINRIHRL